MRKSFAGVLLVSVLGAAVAGCGGSSSSTARGPAAAVVAASPAKTLAMNSADASVTITEGTSVSLSSSGSVDFTENASEQHLTFAGLPSDASKDIPVPLTLLWIDHKAYLEATEDLAFYDAGKQWVQITPGLAREITKLGGSVAPLSAVVSDLAAMAAGASSRQLLDLFTTSDVSVADDGAAMVDTTRTARYHLVLDTAHLVQDAPNGAKSLFEGLGPKTSADVWLDSDGRICQLQTKLMANGTPIDVTVQLANFGRGVSEIAPQPGQIGTFSS